MNFDCVYNIINDEEKRNVVTALIKEIEIYRNDESEYPLKRIGLNFPVFKDGGEVTELLWDKGNTVETICQLVKVEKIFRECIKVGESVCKTDILRLLPISMYMNYAFRGNCWISGGRDLVADIYFIPLHPYGSSGTTI